MSSEDDFNARLAHALREYMEEHGVTQTAVAEELTRAGERDRTQNYVSGRLNGKGGVSLSADIIAAVATLTGRSPRVLMFELLTDRMGR